MRTHLLSLLLLLTGPVAAQLTPEQSGLLALVEALDAGNAATLALRGDVMDGTKAACKVPVSHFKNVWIASDGEISAKANQADEAAAIQEYKALVWELQAWTGSMAEPWTDKESTPDERKYKEHTFASLDFSGSMEATLVKSGNTYTLLLSGISYK